MEQDIFHPKKINGLLMESGNYKILNTSRGLIVWIQSLRDNSKIVDSLKGFNIIYPFFLDAPRSALTPKFIFPIK